ncbi:MAG: DUF6387 family protein [Gammaproteobacteria bacterium]
MTSRIKNISELPQWFQLDKYKVAKKLNAAGWYEQFAIRGKLMEWFNTEVEPKFQDMLKTELADSLILIRETPIFDIHGAGKGKLSGILFFADAEYICKNHNNIPAVHPMTLEQFNLVRGGIDPKKLEYAKLWSKQFEAEEIDFSRVYKYEPWIRQSLTHSAIDEAKDENGFGFRGIDPVVVDLNFPDKILIESFKQYLAARRAESKTQYLSKPFRQQEFYDWIRFGVLPYLDLKLWELDTGNKIPLRVIADAIYPVGEGGEETVRKTTAPLANTLIHNNNLRMLIAQVAAELAVEGV